MSRGNPNDHAGPSARCEETEEEREAHYYKFLCAPPEAHGRSSPPIRGEDQIDDGNEADDEEMEDVQEEHPSADETHPSADETTTSGAGGDTTDGGSEARRARKERRRNTVGTLCQEFTEVDVSGNPTLPIELVKGYDNTTTAMLRENVSINTENIRGKDNVALATLLIQKLHARYKFSDEYCNTDLKNNVVNTRALGRFSKALSTWRSTVRRLLDKGDEGMVELKKTFPEILDADLAIFKAKASTTSDKAHQVWGKSCGTGT